MDEDDGDEGKKSNILLLFFLLLLLLLFLLLLLLLLTSFLLPFGALGTKLTVLVLALIPSPVPSIHTYMAWICKGGGWVGESAQFLGEEFSKQQSCHEARMVGHSQPIASF